jgi:hypothetical protein
MSTLALILKQDSHFYAVSAVGGAPWLGRDFHNKFEQRPDQWIAVIEAKVPDKLVGIVSASASVRNNKPTASKFPA